MTIAADAPFDAEAFAAALCEEELGGRAHYIGEPIFLCMDAVCKKVTMGESQFPFSLPWSAALNTMSPPVLSPVTFIVGSAPA